jgi:hypothetical protein
VGIRQPPAFYPHIYLHDIDAVAFAVCIPAQYGKNFFSFHPYRHHTRYSHVAGPCFFPAQW